MAYADMKQHAHEIIDRMAPGQVSALVALLETMIDPLTRILADAPLDDEPVDVDELQSGSAARRLVERMAAIPNEEILEEFGLTPEDFDCLGMTPLSSEASTSTGNDVSKNRLD